MAKKKKEKKGKGKTEVHDKLEGFHIEINEFGERISNKSMDEINKFLNEEMDDKKLSDRKKEKGEEE